MRRSYTKTLQKVGYQGDDGILGHTKKDDVKISVDIENLKRFETFIAENQ